MNQHWVLVLLLLGFAAIQEQGIFLRVEADGGDDDHGGFVQISGNKFLLDATPFYPNGFNAYWLMMVASDPHQRDKVSSAFQQAENLSLTVVRTWAFSDGSGDGSVPLQFSPGYYNEQMFQGLDYVISVAKSYGIRLILSLVNNYKDLGGKNQYVNWARERGQSLSSEDDFFTNTLVKLYFKNHIKTVLTRNNSATGTVYKDDPTIMAWELMNEPRCQSDLSGKSLQAWIEEMASYVKSIDSNHLLEVGLEGFYGAASSDRLQYNPQSQLGTDFIYNNQIPRIDFATVHSYPDQWLANSNDQAQQEFLKKWVDIHIRDAQDILNKPVIFAEFGKSRRDPGFTVAQRDQTYELIYSRIFHSANAGGPASGGLFWQLLVQGMENYDDGYEVLANESPSTASLIADYSQKLQNIRKRYARLRPTEAGIDRAKGNKKQGKNP